MKIGIHLSTYTKTWSENVIPYLKPTAEIGYEGVEFPLGDPFSFDYKGAKEALKIWKLACTCGIGLNPGADISSTDDQIRARGIDYLKRAIDICEYLESDCLGGVLYGPWGEKKSRRVASENIQRSVMGLKEVAQYGKEKGVTLSLEILNRYESYFINTMQEGIGLVEAVGEDNVKLHFDTFHAHIEETNIKKAIMKGKSHIYHVHFCENTRGVPGTGSINWSEVKEGLTAINYDRWIMVENFVAADCEIGNQVGIWYDREASGLEAAKKAFTFINKLIRE